MNAEKISKYTFLIILLLFLVLTVFLLKPFIAYIVLAMIFAYIFRPAYELIENRIRKKSLAASIVVTIVIFVLVIPTLLITKIIIQQGSTALTKLNQVAENSALEQLNVLGYNINLEGAIHQFVTSAKNFIVEQGPGIISSAADVIIGIFITFFIMFYLLKEWDKFFSEINDLVPLKKKYKIHFFREVEDVTKAVLYGQVLTAIIQGALYGLGFIMAGIPNAFFWTFVMIILCFLPVVGAPIVWIPGAIYLYITGQLAWAIFLLIYSGVFIMQLDNVIKPKLISNKIRIHPAVILLGVLGGLKVFGFVGIILGPLVISLLIVLLRFYVSDFKLNV
ncbi:AI-2E family transporter [Candidatus Woesearchaeota archaeon]|nr:AI-2E family transporter [Candidatus Woesearchaeota archaeon]